MRMAIEDKELDAELQELYLTGKQWLADMDFLGTELDFLKKLSKRSTNRTISNPLAAKLVFIEKSSAELKRDVLAYLHELEPLITSRQKNIKLNLIEINSCLRQRLVQVLTDFHSARKALFDFFKLNLKKTQSLNII